MESQPQNIEFMNNPEMFHQCNIMYLFVFPENQQSNSTISWLIIIIFLSLFFKHCLLKRWFRCLNVQDKSLNVTAVVPDYFLSITFFN